MRKNTCLFVISLSILLLNAQPPSVEALKMLIASSAQDSVKAKAYYELCKMTRGVDIKLATLYADSGYYHFKKMGDEAGMQQREYIQATLAYGQGDYTQALQSGLKYNEWTIQSGNIEREWYAASMLAMCYRETGEYHKGIQASLRGIDIGLQLQRDAENGFFYNELGNLYSTLRQWDEAYTYLYKAYDLSLTTKYPQGQAVALRNLAANAIERKKLDEAQAYILKAKTIDSTGGFAQSLSRSYQSLARLAELRSSPDEAIQYLNQAKQTLNEESNPYDIAMIYQSLAKNYLLKNNLDSVHQFIVWSAQKGEHIDATDFVSEQKRIESALYEKQGDFKKAFLTLKSYVEKNSQQLNSEVTNQIAGLNVKHETKRKEDEIALLTSNQALNAAQLKAVRTQMAFSIVGLILFSILSYYIFRLWNKTKIQNALISKSLSEKETLIQEIHHRVKNNLQFISSLLNLQARHVEDQSALNALREGQNRVKSMALIHQNLYQEHNLTGIETKKYLETLMHNLFQSYNISPDKIKLVTHIDSLQIDVDSMIPLGLIMNELISNALKYAFPEPNRGTIQVSLKEKKGILILEVADDGIGMPNSKKDQAGQSFGYRLINAFKSQLDADLEIKNEKGTQVVMRIKNYKKAA